ncbi:hypothetical protein [Parabacteroides timonensis]|uniref:hypothetical protein n=1 Tax=Parabacteroides timonensis TaxID=1871013 RepID=UPI00094E0920|nr:hypothetical protein [Parabacteroides timonensis]
MGNHTDEFTLIFENNQPSTRWKTRRIHTAFDKSLCRVEKPIHEIVEEYNTEKELWKYGQKI